MGWYYVELHLITFDLFVSTSCLCTSGIRYSFTLMAQLSVVGVGIACSIVEVRVNLSSGKWEMSLYSSRIFSMDALSLFNWCSLSWLRRLESLLPLPATAENFSASVLSLSSRPSNTTHGSSAVWSASVVFVVLVKQTPFTVRVRFGARYTPGSNSFLSRKP